VEVGLYTDSVGHLGFEEALDFAAEIGTQGIEIAAGGQSSASHMRVPDLVDDAGARRAFVDAFDRRGLRIAALNCSAWPLHPVVGDHHTEIIKPTIRLAGQIGVTKIVTIWRDSPRSMGSCGSRSSCTRSISPTTSRP